MNRKHRSFLKILLSLGTLGVLSSCASDDRTASAPTKARELSRSLVYLSEYKGDFIAAMASLPSWGGTIIVDMPVTITAPIHVRHGVKIMGVTAPAGNNANKRDGEENANRNTNQLNQLHVTVEADVGFILYGASCIESLFIHRQGVEFTDIAEGNFKGRAIEIIGDDVRIIDNFITGFDQGIVGEQVQRSRISGNNIDCTNGIWLHNVYDLARLSDNHIWCWVTVNAGVPAATLRVGFGIRLSGVNDWTECRGNFVYGHAVGIHLIDCAQVRLFGCKVDGMTFISHGTGFLFEGNCINAMAMGCQAAGQNIAFANRTLVGVEAPKLIGCSYWGNTVDTDGEFKIS